MSKSPETFPINLDAAVPLLHDYLLRSAVEYPQKLALVCHERRLTYSDVDSASNKLAHQLVRQGVQRGDRVIVFGENTIETGVAFWAVLKANAVVSVVNPQTKARKLAHLINDCRAAVMITEPRLLPIASLAVPHASRLRCTLVSGEPRPEALASVRGAIPWDDVFAAPSCSAPPTRTCIDIDLAAIVYTSGSSGDSKGVMLSHRNMITAATSVSTYLGMQIDDVVLLALPMAFDYGLYQMIMSFRLGALLVIERSPIFAPSLVQTMAAEGVTIFPGIPTIFSLLTATRRTSPYELPQLRSITSTAALLSSEQISRLQVLFPGAQIFSMYGLTECQRCTYLPPGDLARKPGSVGIPIPNTELWLVDQNDEPVPVGQVGQLVIRGGTVMVGYWDNPTATAVSLRAGRFPTERVLYTGDQCRLDDDGYLYFVGRMDEVFKSSGEKVSPHEVETALLSIAGVIDAAVVGVHDQVLGLAVKAFVVLENGCALTESDIRRVSHQSLQAFMVPKYVEFLRELPKTSTGKTDRQALRDR